MSQYVESRCKTLQANGSLGVFLRVRLDPTTELLNLAGATDTDCVGVTQRPVFATDDVPDPGVPVALISAQGTTKVTAAGSFSAGPVYAAAAGQVAGSGSVLAGIALEAATAEGDIIEMIQLPTALLPGAAQAVYTKSLTDLRAAGTLGLLGNAAGTPAGAFGITPGTFGSASPLVVGESASAASKTDVCRFSFALPQEYQAGQAISLKVKAAVSALPHVGATLAVAIYAGDGAGGASAQLVTTSAQPLTATMTVLTFAITSTALVPGQVLDCELTGVCNDTGGTTGAVIQIGSVQFSVDARG